MGMLTTPDKLSDAIEMLKRMVTHNSYGSDLWDVVTCLRGPDSPSEKDTMDKTDYQAAYKARRKRKHDTVEVIRGMSVGQVGAARTRAGSSITLPPSAEWDHYDKHCARAAKVLGLDVHIKGEKVDPTVPVKLGESVKAKLASGVDSGVMEPAPSICYTYNSGPVVVKHPVESYMQESWAKATAKPPFFITLGTIAPMSTIFPDLSQYPIVYSKGHTKAMTVKKVAGDITTQIMQCFELKPIKEINLSDLTPQWFQKEAGE